MSTQAARDIDIQLASMREELTKTVNELAGKFTPDNISNEAKKTARKKVDDIKASARNLVSEATSGDTRAIAILGGIALGALLIARRIIRH